MQAELALFYFLLLYYLNSLIFFNRISTAAAIAERYRKTLLFPKQFSIRLEKYLQNKNVLKKSSMHWM